MRLGSRLDFIGWNPTQLEAINSLCPEIYFAGANQIGKTAVLLAQVVWHATGKYPKWYRGKRWTKPVTIMLAGETIVSTRNVLAFPLLGRPGNYGHDCYMPRDVLGKDPRERIKKSRLGVADAVDYVLVDHHDENGKKDGESIILFFAYSMGKDVIQGIPAHLVGVDEEPEEFDVYDEFSARLNETQGELLISASPLRGYSDIYNLFEAGDGTAHELITYGVDKATHLSPERIAFLYKKYEHHWNALPRLHGVPTAGEGVIYKFPDDKILVPRYKLQSHWKSVIGLDFPWTTGYFAAAKIVVDEDSPKVRLVAEYKGKDPNPMVHAQAVKALGGDRIPCAWPKDGGIKAMDGEAIREKYRSYGLNLLPYSAGKLLDSGKRHFSVTNTIEEVCELAALGNLEVFEGCAPEFLKEKTTYRAKDGKPIQKQAKDVIDAFHKAISTLDAAIPLDQVWDRFNLEKLARSMDRDFYES